MARHFTATITVTAALVFLAGTAGAKSLEKCTPDAVAAGAVCIDRYEASVWRVPGATSTNRGLAKRIQLGKVTVADLTAAGATQLGAGVDDYAPCADSGQNCADDIFAVSLPGVVPSGALTWFQALAACENARKRLPTSAEWQAAVAGTPDPGPDDGTTDCNSNSGSTTLTGARKNCVSTRGAFDMVGNVWEWVSEWVPHNTSCGAWSTSTSPTGDLQCMLNATSMTGEPGAVMRGGHFAQHTSAGPLAVSAVNGPSISHPATGFRCAR